MQDAAIPGHIPAHLVVDYDRFAQPELKRCPHQRINALFKSLPPIFYTPRNGGHWVVARSSEAVEMLRKPEIFSSNPSLNRQMQRSPRTAPNQYDPPEHTELRNLVNPFFQVGAIPALEPQIRVLARRLIDEVLPRGECEFLTEIAQRFPVEIFLTMAGAPLDDREVLIGFVERFTREPELADRLQALRELADHLKQYMDEREARPTDDLLGVVVTGTLNGKPLTDEEKLGFASLLFLGGLDTVASMLSFIMAHLATHPENYARLVNDPDIIPRAVEELMRVHGVAAMERAVAVDTEYAGVTFRKGDRLLFVPQVYGLDNPRIENPLVVDFDRKMTPQLIFGAGPHRCIGSHLAMAEIRIFLQEWTASLPIFSMEGEPDPETFSGIVWSPVAVPLRWDARRAVGN